MFEKLKNTPSVATFINLWPYLKPEKKWMYLVIAATLALTVVEITFPILIGKYIDILLQQARGEAVTAAGFFDGGNIIAILAVGAALRGFLIFQQRAIAGRVGQKVAARMRDSLWSHLQNLPVEYSRRRGPGRLLVRFISDARAVQRLVSRGIVQLAQDVLVVVGVMGVLVYLDVLMGLIVVGLIPIIGVIFWILNPRLTNASKDMRNRRSKLSAHLNGRVKGLEVIKSFGHQRSEAREVRRMNRNVVKYGIKRDREGGLLIGVSAAAVALVTVLVIAVASVEVVGGRLTAGELLIFYALIGMLAPVFQRITIVDRTLQEAQISVQRFTETLAQKPENPEEVMPDLEITEGVVSIEGLSFEYPDGARIFEDVDVTARRGELTVLTGPNGAGKSTLLELLMRFKEPSEGSVSVDGQDLSNVSLDSLRSRISLVGSDAPLFDGTIRENISYGLKKDIPDDELERVARISGVDKLVETLPDGWDTRVREGKREFSDGERQRVSLARALAVNPDILLLDYAASAMDETSVREIVENLRDLAQEKTVIIATHRMPAMLAADKVYAMNGHTIEVSADKLRESYENGGADDVARELANSNPGGIRKRAVATAPRRSRDLDDEDDDDE